MLQILLLISYKLARHQSQKIILNIYSLYCLSNTNISNVKPCYLFTYFTVLVCSFCFAPRLTPISQLFSFFFSIIIFTIFTINDTFHSNLLLSNTRDVTNFTTYILQIGTSPITKNNSKYLFIILFFTVFYCWVILKMLQILLLRSYKLARHQSQKIILNIYSLYCLSNTHHIFSTSIYKLFVVNFVVTMNWLFLFIYFNDMKYIYFLIIVYLFCYYYLLIFFRLISL